MKKKKSLKKLALNKKAISNLRHESIVGGTIPTLGVICSIIVVGSAIACTRWEDCDLPTIGSGDGSDCISTDGQGICGGR